MFIGKFSMCAVNLLIEIAGIDEKYSFILASCFVEEPKSGGRVTEKNILLGSESIALTMPSSTKRARISASDFPASVAIEAMTRAARPVSLSAVAN